METIHSIRPLLAILASLFAIPFIVGFSRRPAMREFWTFAAAGSKFLIIVSMLPLVLTGRRVTCTIFEIIPGVPLQLTVDTLGLLFALVSSSLWILTSIYSVGYMRGLGEHSQTRYFCFFAVALSATIGVAFSANLLTLYIFYEILSLATYPLVTHHQDEEARSSGRRYLAYILGSSIGLFLPAMLISYHLAGTLTFSASGFLGASISRKVLMILLIMFVFGAAKAAVMPLHAWLPAAMVAPTPVSALLHAVAVVKVGVFVIIRIITGVFGVNLLKSLSLTTPVIVLACITILCGSLIALSQDNLKRLLAYSTISQLSYIVLGVSLLSQRGLTGAFIHIPMHAFGKITLFFCAGAIFVATGKKNISEMKGLGRQMPITMAAFFIASLSIIGLPPCGGFLSKWNLVLGSIEAHRPLVLVVLLVSSLLNAGYFMPVVYKAFFFKTESAVAGVKEAPLCCLIPLCLTAIFSIIFLFYPQPFYELISHALKCIIGAGV